MASIAARLLVLADLVRTDPVRAEAELRAWATEPDTDAVQRSTAGRASAAARTMQVQATKAGALAIARSVRRTSPAASQEAVASGVKARFGALVPGEDGLRRWVRSWEASGELPIRVRQRR